MMSFLSTRKPEIGFVVPSLPSHYFLHFDVRGFHPEVMGADVGQIVARLAPWPARFIHTHRVGAVRTQTVIEEFTKDRVLITYLASTVVAGLTAPAVLEGIKEGVHRFLAAGLSITDPSSTSSSPSHCPLLLCLFRGNGVRHSWWNEAHRYLEGQRRKDGGLTRGRSRVFLQCRRILLLPVRRRGIRSAQAQRMRRL